MHSSVKAVLLLLSLASTGLAATQNRPNIVFVLLDNLGQEWLGCYGGEDTCTPNIDRLAQSGVRFENCYTPPVCGPSRITLLTGRYLLRSGMLLHHDAALYGGGGLDPKHEITFARLFRDAGYATAVTGKWQINNLYDEPGILLRHGFEEHLIWPGSVDFDKVSAGDLAKLRAAVEGDRHDEVLGYIQNIESRYWDPVFLRNGRRERLPGRFGPDVSQEFARDFLRRNRDRPFFLYYPMVLTHGQTASVPVVPTPRNPERARSHREMFADMVRYADDLVGDLVKTLDELKLRDNTLLFIATDNGTESQLTARRDGRPVRGGLYSLSEAGGNVALIANAPRHFPGGRVVPLADFSDVLPTLCGLASVPVPRDLVLDGRSHAPVLRGDAGAHAAREWMFNQYGNLRTVRDDRFKLYSDGRLFDVGADPAEQRDLQGSSDAVIVQAKMRLQGVLASLPADAAPPFPLRSLSAFKLRTEERARLSR